MLEQICHLGWNDGVLFTSNKGQRISFRRRDVNRLDQFLFQFATENSEWISIRSPSFIVFQCLNWRWNGYFFFYEEVSSYGADEYFYELSNCWHGVNLLIQRLLRRPRPLCRGYAKDTDVSQSYARFDDADEYKIVETNSSPPLDGRGMERRWNSARTRLRSIPIRVSRLSEEKGLIIIAIMLWLGTDRIISWTIPIQ